MRAAAYCTCSVYILPELLAYLRERYTVTRFREVLHIHLPNHAEEGDVFFFPYGTMVCWGVGIEGEKNLLAEIRQFEQESDQVEEDEFTYVYGTHAKLEDDEITVPDQNTLTKLAFSHGLAQSAKLGSFEQAIHKTVHITQQLPEVLAKKGRITLSRREIRRMMGRLFLVRSSINLHQELLDTPEFFWEHPDLEPYYAMVAHYLDRERRVNVLNQRLKILQELFDVLNTELNHQHSSRLEWTIIGLIVIEVVLYLGEILKVFKG